MKQTITLTLFLTTFLLVAQTKKHETFYDDGSLKQTGQYKNGKKTGTWKYYLKNGKISEVSNYRNGVAHGPYKYYFDTGEIEEFGNYDNGQPHGKYESFYRPGKLEKKGTYDNGKEVGVWIKNEYSGGKLLKESRFLNGKKHGENKVYWESNGKIKRIERYENGKYVEYKGYYRDGGMSSWQVMNPDGSGTSKDYDERGRLTRLETYRNDKRNGRFEKYSSGKKREIGAYKDGKKHSYWRVYDRYENIKEEGEYDAGIKTGVWKYYYTNLRSKKHRLSEKGSYVKGQKSGDWTFYNADGKKEGIYVYNNDEKMKTIKDGITLIYDKDYYVVGEEHYKRNKLVKKVKYIIKGNNIVDKETYVNGKLVSRASDPVEKTFYVYFNNKCQRKVSVAVKFLDNKGKWQTKAWYELKKNKRSYLFSSKNRIFYYYAQSKNKYWAGSKRFYVGSKLYRFREKKLSGQRTTETINLTCSK